MLLAVPYSEYFAKLVEVRSLVDIALVYTIVYAVLKLVRGTRAAPMCMAIGAFVVLYWLAAKQNLATLEFILRGPLFYVGIVVVVLFQAEIRQALTSFGNRMRQPLHPLTRRERQGQFGEGAYDEVVLAATTLASTKTGALVVIERAIGLRNVIDGGVRLDAELSYDLLVTIFNPTTPLHDGAVVVRHHRVAAAACFLPLTLNPLLSKDLGTRHRAAIGITEDTDAVAVVVSEETGVISFVQGGKIKRGLDATKLRAAVFDALETSSPKREKERLLTEAETETNKVVST